MIQMKAGDVAIVVLEPKNLEMLQKGFPIELDLTNPALYGPDIKKIVLWYAKDKEAVLQELRKAGLITQETVQVLSQPKTVQ